MEKDIYKSMGGAVRGHRVRLGWSQEDLGERAGLHPSYIGQIERGVKKVSIATLQKLAAALKVGIPELLPEKPVFAGPSSWETKLAGIVRDRPPEQQELIYRLARETLRSRPRGKKRAAGG